MANILTRFWDWLGDKKNLARFGAIIAALALVGTFVGWVTGLFEGKPPITVIATPTDQPFLVMTKEDFEAELEKRATEVEAALATATEAERTRLEAEKAEIARRLADIEGALAERDAKIRNLEALLLEAGSAVSVERLQEAREALSKGDFSKADDLFAEIEASAQAAVQSTARAAYGRGEIAEEEIRWADAAAHFARAAGLDPTYDSLFKAREFAWRAGDYARAAGFGAKLIRLARKEFGEESTELATALNAHAQTVHALGRYADAEPLFRQALEIDAKTIGTKHPDHAINLNNLASLLQDMGRYDEAEPLYRQALEIGAKTIGTAHPDYATRLNNLAVLLKNMGRHDEAEPLYRKALEITGDSLGKAHPSYATRLNNLALMLANMGRYNEAGPLYVEALEILQAKLGPDHPNTKQGEANYAAFLAERDGGASE